MSSIPAATLSLGLALSACTPTLSISDAADASAQSEAATRDVVSPLPDATDVSAPSDIAARNDVVSPSPDVVPPSPDAADDVADDAPRACAASTECPCGQRCVGGACVLSDCSDALCFGADQGRVCTCVDGILDIDGRMGAQYPTQDVVYRRRPFTAADDNTDLVVRNLRVHDATDQKGVHVTRCESTNNWVYRSVTIQCVEVFNVNRDAQGEADGLHMDYIKYDGCGTGDPRDVTLEDVYVHDGNVYSLVSDARIGTLTLRRVRHENTQGAFQIGTLTNPTDPLWGAIDLVRVEDSPGLRVALLGDKIALVRVSGSPGFEGGMGTPVRVVYEDAASCPTRTLGSNECCVTATVSCGP